MNSRKPNGATVDSGTPVGREQASRMPSSDPSLDLPF